MYMRCCLRWLLSACVCLSVLFSSIPIVSAADNKVVFPSDDLRLSVTTGVIVNNSFRQNATTSEYKSGSIPSSSTPLSYNSQYYKSWQEYIYRARFIDVYGGKFGSQGSTLKFSISHLQNYIKDGNGVNWYLDGDWCVDYISIILSDNNGSSQIIPMGNTSIRYSQTSGGTFNIEFETELMLDVYEIEIECLSSMEWFYSSANGQYWGESYMETAHTPFTWYGGWESGVVSITETLHDPTDDLVEESNNLLDTILGWLRGIWEGITNLPSNIANSIKGFFDNVTSSISSLGNRISVFFANLSNDISGFFDDLLTGILDGLKDLFVPDEESIIDIKEDFLGLLEDRFGALYEAVALIDDYASTFSEHKQDYITFPKVSIPLAGVEFVFGGWEVKIVPDGFGVLIEGLKLIISIISTVLFVNGLRNRFERVVFR